MNVFKVCVPLVMIFVASVACGDVQTQAFRAELSSGSVISGGISGSMSSGQGFADLTLTWDPADPSTATLSYDIELMGDLDGTQTADLNDDVTAIHFHNVDACVSAGCIAGDTGGTLHVLNVFGVPRHDDGDMVFSAADGTISGLWDAADANTLTPAPSQSPAENLQRILDGELFIMVHTREYPSGAFGGFANAVPEPTGWTLSLLAGFCLTWARKR